MTYALKFQDLSLGYDRQPAVHRLQGEIAEGSLTAIVGPNGAGKSTMLKGVTGSLRPLQGRIAFGRLRLIGGRFVLKAELGDAALQILVPSGRLFGPRDGIMAKLDLDLPLRTPIGRIRDLWLVSGRPPPPPTPPSGGARTARWSR